MNVTSHVIQLIKQPRPVRRGKVTTGLIANAFFFGLDIVEAMVEMAALSRRKPTILIDPRNFVAQEGDPFSKTGRTAIPHVSIGGGWNARLLVMDWRRSAVAISFRTSDTLLSAVPDHPPNDSAAYAA
jgi:hypothetical protein